MPENFSTWLVPLAIAAIVLLRLILPPVIGRLVYRFDILKNKERRADWVELGQSLQLELTQDTRLDHLLAGFLLADLSWNAKTGVYWPYVLSGEVVGAKFWLAEYYYQTSQYHYRRHNTVLISCTVLIVEHPDWNWSPFSIVPRDGWNSGRHSFTPQAERASIVLETLKDSYKLDFRDPVTTDLLFSDQVLTALKTVQRLYWEGAGQRFLFYYPDRKMTPYEIRLFYRDAMELVRFVRQNS